MTRRRRMDLSERRFSEHGARVAFRIPLHRVSRKARADYCAANVM